MDKLISARENKLGLLLDLVRVLGLDGLLSADRGFAGSLARKHGGLVLTQALLRVYARHRALLSTGTGLAQWDTALASELNGKLETISAPKPKLTDAQTDVVAGMLRLGTKLAVAEPIVASLPATLSPAEMFGAALKKLDHGATSGNEER